MALSVERVGDVAVVKPKGMLKGGKETDEVENTLRKLIYGDEKKVLLNLSNVTFMSSMAIGVLAQAHSSAIKRDVRFGVCGVNERDLSVLVLVKLRNILNLFDDCNEAARSL